MKQSPLYNYYKRFENWMLTNILTKNKLTIINTKKPHTDYLEWRHEVIRILNKENICGLHVYDALFFDYLWT
jgi:hypothetical protein